MTEAKTNSKSKSNVLSLVYMAMFVAIITVCAQIQIPMTVPFTLQTLGIFMAAAMLGWKRGLISVAVYVLLGAIGVPRILRRNRRSRRSDRRLYHRFPLYGAYRWTYD